MIAKRLALLAILQLSPDSMRFPISSFRLSGEVCHHCKVKTLLFYTLGVPFCLMQTSQSPRHYYQPGYPLLVIPDTLWLWLWDYSIVTNLTDSCEHWLKCSRANLKRGFVAFDSAVDPASRHARAYQIHSLKMLRVSPRIPKYLS